MKIESEKFTKLREDEDEKMRMQLDSETDDVLKYHEQHMAQVCGRLLAAHARKQAALPAARLDPTICKVEVCLLF